MRWLVLPLLGVFAFACTSTNDAGPDGGAGDAGAPDATPASDDGGADVSPSSDAPSAPDDPCFKKAVVAPPAALGLDAFYKKYVDADGIPIVSSDKAPDAALQRACFIVNKMLGKRADVRSQMIAHDARVTVMAATEVTTDVPEHADLYTLYPGTDWDKRARGLGGTLAKPVTSCAEENLLCEGTDSYKGENILVHEFAHGVHALGVEFVDDTFASRLAAAHAAALAAGKWKETYAETNPDEYWAEGVQSWFETNLQATPANGIHNEVNTRAELAAYDPALHALIAEVFTDERWTPGCP